MKDSEAPLFAMHTSNTVALGVVRTAWRLLNEGSRDTIDGVSNSLKRSDRRIVQQDVRDY